jgi:hypothetical protein
MILGTNYDCRHGLELHSLRAIIAGAVAMAKRRNAEVLEYILMNLGLLSWMAQEADLTVLESVLKVAAMEAEYQLTGVFPPPRLRH